MRQLLIYDIKLSNFFVLFYNFLFYFLFYFIIFFKILTFRGKKWAFWRKQSTEIFTFPADFKKTKNALASSKKMLRLWKVKDIKDKILFKKFRLKSFSKKIFFMSKKINFNFFLLKFYPFLASQEFHHKSILKPRFEAGEAEGSCVERPKKFKNKNFKWQFFNFLRRNFDFF